MARRFVAAAAPEMLTPWIGRFRLTASLRLRVLKLHCSTLAEINGGENTENDHTQMHQRGIWGRNCPIAKPQSLADAF